MKQFHWLLCAAKNCDWSRNIMPLSNLTQASLLVEWKLTVKAKLNCEIYKSWRKCWKNRVSFCHQSSPVSWIAWTLPWILQESVEKVSFENLQLQSTLEVIQFEFWMKEALATVEISVLCGWKFCDTVGCELWRYTLFAAVPWNGLENTHRKARLWYTLKKAVMPKRRSFYTAIKRQSSIL